MAYDICDHCHPGDGAIYHNPRRTEKAEDEWSDIHKSHCSNWSCVQYEFDLRKLGIPVPERLVHPDVEGMIRRAGLEYFWQ